jgi:FixJ family two-component response regulator
MIAIIDDDPDVGDALHFLLGAMGLEARRFSSATDFLAATPANFTKVILDHHMPGMTGLELADRLRSAGVMTPIMLVSGGLTPDVIRRAHSLGINQVADKPADVQLLAAFLELDDEAAAN